MITKIIRKIFKKISLKRKKKSIVFLDTNGFHRGGYVTKDRRVLTMATFLRPITPYVDQNTKLLLDGIDKSNYTSEALYALDD